jgi:DNA-binding response OmpR family regulator
MKKSYKILIVEDEEDISIYLSKILIKIGHTVVASVTNGNEAIEFFSSQDVDLIFMDINIKGSIDGIQLARMLNTRKKVAVIFTTAYSDDSILEDAISNFTYGYVVKPFDEKDIKIALTVATERLKDSMFRDDGNDLGKENFIRLSEKFSFDSKNQILFRNDGVIKLTKKEAKVLNILCKNINHIVSFETLHQDIWNKKIINDSTIRCIISSIRKKLEDVQIDTVYGMGYILRG